MITQFIKNKLPYKNINNYLAFIIGLLLLISLNSNSAHLELLLNNKLDFNNLVVVFNGLRFLIPFLIFPILIFIYIYKFRSVISKKTCYFFLFFYQTLFFK